MFYVVGDLHLKDKMPYFLHQKKFLEWLNSNYSHYPMIFLGDEVDVVSPRWEMFSFFVDFLKARNAKTYILNGNHTHSRIKGNLLDGIKHLSNVKVFFKEEEFELGGYKCLALPYQYNMNHYNDISTTVDFVFGHLMIQQEAFGGEYTKIENINYKYFINGHIHLKKKYENIILPGCPVATRNGESNNPILQIKDKFIIEEITPPETFKIQDINYGDEIVERDWLYNVKDAPSIQSVYVMYPDCYIREEGITIKRDKSELEDLLESKSENNSISQEFVEYAKDKEIDVEIQNCCLKYLEGI